MATKNPGDSTFDLDPQAVRDRADAELANSHIPPIAPAPEAPTVAEQLVELADAADAGQLDESTPAPKKRGKRVSISELTEVLDADAPEAAPAAGEIVEPVAAEETAAPVEAPAGE